MYPNPYLMNTVPKIGLLSRGLSAIKSIKWSTLLDGTQKTLGVINQAIPIVYQIKPIVNNAKTIFKIADSLKEETPQPEKTTPSPTINNTTTNTASTNPIFYI